MRGVSGEKEEAGTEGNEAHSVHLVRLLVRLHILHTHTDTNNIIFAYASGWGVYKRLVRFGQKGHAVWLELFFAQ